MSDDAVRLGGDGAPSLFPVTPNAGEMLDRSWQGVRRILIVVATRGAGTIDPGDVARDLQARVARLAAEGSPCPVECVEPAAAMTAGLDRAVLAVHGAVEQRNGASPLLVLAMRRTMAAGLEPMPILFGAAPRTVPLDGDAAALDAAIGEGLAEILPWRRQ